MCGNVEKINGTTPHSRRWYVQPPARKKTRAGRLAHPEIIGPLRGYPPLTPPGGKLAGSKHSGISNTLTSSIQALPPTPYHLSKICGPLRGIFPPPTPPQGGKMRPGYAGYFFKNGIKMICLHCAL
jgi:hypothetical protein